MSLVKGLLLRDGGNTWKQLKGIKGAGQRCRQRFLLPTFLTGLQCSQNQRKYSIEKTSLKFCLKRSHAWIGFEKFETVTINVRLVLLRGLAHSRCAGQIPQNRPQTQTQHKPCRFLSIVFPTLRKSHRGIASKRPSWIEAHPFQPVGRPTPPLVGHSLHPAHKHAITPEPGTVPSALLQCLWQRGARQLTSVSCLLLLPRGNVKGQIPRNPFFSSLVWSQLRKKKPLIVHKCLC